MAWAATEQRRVDDIIAAAPLHWQQLWTTWNADGGGTAWDHLALSILHDLYPPPAATGDSMSDDVDAVPYDEAWWCWFDEVIDDPTMWANYRQRHPLDPTWPGHRKIAATWFVR